MGRVRFKILIINRRKKEKNIVYTLYHMRHGKTRIQFKRESSILQVSIIRRSQRVDCTLEPLHLAKERHKFSIVQYFPHTFEYIKFKVI